MDKVINENIEEVALDALVSDLLKNSEETLELFKEYDKGKEDILAE